MSSTIGLPNRKIFCSYEYIPERFLKTYALKFVRLGFASKSDILISISPWYYFEKKKKHEDKRIILADGVFDLAAIVSDSKTSKIWKSIITSFEYVTPYKKSKKEFHQVQKNLINKSSKKIDGSLRICLATANTPYFSLRQEQRIKRLYSQIIQGANDLDCVEVYYCPGKNAKKLFNEILTSENTFYGKVKDLEWCLHNCHILVSTKSTILVDADKYGLIPIEVINKILGDSVSSIKLFDSDSIESLLRSLRYGSQYENVGDLYIHIINEIQKND